MKLNVLFTVKNIALLLIGLFYLLIFTHNLLGNIFEGYESMSTNEIADGDSPTTIQNKLELQNAMAQINAESQKTQGFEDKDKKNDKVETQ